MKLTKSLVMSMMSLMPITQATAQTVPDLSGLIATASSSLTGALSAGAMPQMPSSLSGLPDLSVLTSSFGSASEVLGSSAGSLVGSLPLSQITHPLADGVITAGPYFKMATDALAGNLTGPVGQLETALLGDIKDADAMLPVSIFETLVDARGETVTGVTDVVNSLLGQEVPSVPTNVDELLSSLDKLPQATAGYIGEAIMGGQDSLMTGGLIGNGGLLTSLTNNPMGLADALAADGQTLVGLLADLPVPTDASGLTDVLSSLPGADMLPTDASALTGLLADLPVPTDASGLTDVLSSLPGADMLPTDASAVTALLSNIPVIGDALPAQ